MDTSSLVDSFVSERDIAAFREIFEQEDNEESPSASLPAPAASGLKEEDLDAFRMKVIISAGVVFLSVIIIFILVPVASLVYNNNSSADSKKTDMESEHPLNPEDAFVELTMHPQRGSNIGVFILRSTQPPAAIMADTSILFQDSD